VRAWLVITHICQFWRAAAIADPHLWASVTWQSTALAQLFMARAGVVPLSIDIPQQSDETLKEALVSAHRARFLRVNLRSRAHISMFNFFLAQSHLRRMRCSTLHTTGVGENMVIPKVERMPDLQVLVTEYIGIDWQSLRYCNLTALVVRSVSNCIVRSSDLCGALSSLQSLQILSLHFSLPHSWTGDEPTSITLPNLRLLDFCDVLSRSNELLNRLDVPAGARVNIQDHTSASLHSINELLTRSLAAYLLHPHGHPKEVAVELDANNVTVLAWPDSSATSSPRLDIRIKSLETDAQATMLAIVIRSSLGLSAHTLRLHSSIPLPILAPPAPQIPLALHTVHLTGTYAQKLLLCLPPVACQNLATVDVSQGQLEDSNLERLEVLLRRWKLRGMHLSTLYISEHHTVAPNVAKNVIRISSKSDTALLSELHYIDAKSLAYTLG
jgi:hypothetical protein